MPALWRAFGAAAIGLIAVACSGSGEAIDADGRVMVEDHAEPDGRHVRAALGEITYTTMEGDEAQAEGLLIEVTRPGGDTSVGRFPLPPVDEDFQILGSFGGPGGHFSVFSAPPETALTVTYTTGDELALSVGPDGLAVIVTAGVSELDRVHATSPDGVSCQFLRAPSHGRDCEPAR